MSTGDLHIDGFELSGSAGWSDPARRMFVRRMAQPALTQSSDGELSEADWLSASMSYRANMEELHRQLLLRVAEDHPCHVEDDVIAGVRVRWVTPLAGVAPGRSQQILVNLHGGAFIGGAEHCGLVESLPIASIGGYRICVVDYRQGWEHRFPAATDDVLAVHHWLLDAYRPSGIGMFGYSAGGMLVAQSVARLVSDGHEMPGAIAMCSAGAGGDGDSWSMAAVAMGGRPTGAEDDGRIALGAHDHPARFGYAAGVDPLDPMYSPIHSPALLARFPPSMLLTGSRSFDLSSVLLTHRALLTAGAVAELHAWEGMWHCFPYNHRLPESIDAFDAIIGFFDRHLASR